MAFRLNPLFLFTIVFCLQGLSSIFARPACPGECSEFGFPFGGDFRCAPPCAVPSPPIFLPVPQPVPIRVPQPPKQSVTIPNIILALLPPNPKPIGPRPCPRPAPIVLPLPQPYPLPIQERCGC